MSSHFHPARVWAAVEDWLIPALRLTTHERALYYHLLRRTHLAGRPAVRVSRHKMARMSGLSLNTARHYLGVLAQKGCIRFLDRGLHGILVAVLLPEQIRASQAADSSCVQVAPPSTGRVLAWPRSYPFREKKFREQIFHRDGGRCFYCRWFLGDVCRGASSDRPVGARSIVPAKRGAKNRSRDWTLDHVVPVSRGGSDAATNLVLCCHECNSAKGGMPAEDFLKSLARKKILSPIQFRSRLARLHSF